MASDLSPSPEFLAEDRRGQLVGTSITAVVLTTVVLGARFFGKRFQGGGFYYDDGFLLSAYIVNLGMCALGIVMTQVGGVGRHVAFNQVAQPRALVGWAQCILAFEMVYFISVALPKLSIICLYLRIFNWRGALRNMALVLFALTAATSLSLFGAACFQCRPLAFWWDRTIPGGSCFDVQTFFHAQALPGAVLDLAIMALPVSTIWHLKLPMVKRVALLGVFMFASFGIVASIVRATIFFSTTALEDRTWASIDLVGWSIIETSVYIITGCLPHMRPLLSHYMPAWLKNLVHSTTTMLKSGGSNSARWSSRNNNNSNNSSSSNNSNNSNKGTAGGGGSRYWNSKSGSMGGGGGTMKGTMKSGGGGGGGSGRYKSSGGSEHDDDIELTRPTESLRRASLQHRPLSLEIHPRVNTEASADGPDSRGRGLTPVPSPGQIVVTKEILMTRT